MTSIPKYLNYNELKPMGTPIDMRETRMTPQQTFSNINNNDTIIFQINTPGFIDPYATYINLEVDITDGDPNCYYQVDGSGQSFINEFWITCNGRELERIQEYDQLAVILNDMAYTPEQKMSRKHEGLGFKTNNDMLNTRNYGHPLAKQTMVNCFGSGFTNVIQKTGYRGCYPFYNPYKIDISKETEESVKQTINLPNISEWTSMYRSDEDYSYTPITYDPTALALKYPMEGILRTVTPDFGMGWLKYYWGAFGKWPTNPAELQILKDMIPYERVEKVFGLQDTSNGPDPYFRLNYESYGGLYNEKCTSLCVNQWETKLSKTFPFNGMSLGAPDRIPQTRAFFSFPFLSGLLGALVPKESYKYIPIFAFKDLMLNLRINPNAMFTSGYINDVDKEPWTGLLADMGWNKSMLTQADRKKFRIVKFELVFNVMIFEEAITAAIRNMINSTGIVLNTQSWMLGPQYLIQNTASAAGTWHVNLGFESLKGLYLFYLSNDYLTYNFCRKSFRVSRNINWLQLKIGINYYPNLPIQGNSGDTIDVNVNGPNNEFFIHTLKAFGKFHDVLSDCGLNTTNFAVNCRTYDVTKTESLIDGNYDTSLGHPFIWENNYVGKAIYGINLEGLSQDPTRLSGINTMTNTPFEIQIKTTSANPIGALFPFDRASTMMVFCNYDMLISIKGNEIISLGRS